MGSLIVFILIFLFALALLGLEAWFVVSLIQFIIAAAKKLPDKGRKLGAFIAAAVINFVVPFLVFIVIFFIQYLKLGMY